MEQKMLTRVSHAASKKQDKKFLERIRDFVHKPFSSIWLKQKPNNISETLDFDKDRRVLMKCPAYDIGSYDKLEVIVKDIEADDDNNPHFFDIRSISEINISINGGGDGDGSVCEKKKQQKWPFNIVFVATDFDFLLNHSTMLKKLLNEKPNFHKIYMPHVVHKEFAEAFENFSDVKRMKLDCIRMYFLENLDKLRVESFKESGHQVIKVSTIHDAIINSILKLKQINVNIILITNNQDLRSKATDKDIKASGISEIRQFFNYYSDES